MEIAQNVPTIFFIKCMKSFHVFSQISGVLRLVLEGYDKNLNVGVSVIHSKKAYRATVLSKKD